MSASHGKDLMLKYKIEYVVNAYKDGKKQNQTITVGRTIKVGIVSGHTKGYVDVEKDYGPIALADAGVPDDAISVKFLKLELETKKS